MSTMKVPSANCPIPGDHLIGDGLRIELTSNLNNISVTGDGCRINLVTNIGLLRITGDGCHVNITRNLGFVEYDGDGGRIILGPEPFDRKRIKYTGDGGVIKAGKLRKCKDEIERNSNETNKINATSEIKGKERKTTTTRTIIGKKGRNDRRLAKAAMQ